MGELIAVIIICFVTFEVINFFLCWAVSIVVMKHSTASLIKIIEICEEEDDDRARSLLLKNYKKYQKMD